MAKSKNGINKSDEIRKLLAENPKMPVKDIVATMEARDLKVTSNLVYYLKGKMKGRKGRKTKVAASPAPARAAANGDALTTIVKVKGWAAEVGGMKKLKALIEALSD